MLYRQLLDQLVTPPTIFISGAKSPLTKAFVLLVQFLEQTNTIYQLSNFMVFLWIWFGLGQLFPYKFIYIGFFICLHLFFLLIFQSVIFQCILLN